jgi:hypothetical protein
MLPTPVSPAGPDELRKAVLQSVLNPHFTRDTAGSTRQIAVSFRLPGDPDAQAMPPGPGLRAVAVLRTAPRELAGQPAAGPQTGTLAKILIQGVTKRYRVGCVAHQSQDSSIESRNAPKRRKSGVPPHIRQLDLQLLIIIGHPVYVIDNNRLHRNLLSIWSRLAFDCIQGRQPIDSPRLMGRFQPAAPAHVSGVSLSGVSNWTTDRHAV